MTTRLTLKQVGGSTKGRRETCRQLREGRRPTCRQLRHRRQSWDETQWKTSNWNSQHSSSPDDRWHFFLTVRSGFSTRTPVTRELGTAHTPREGTRQQRPLQSEQHEDHQEHACQRPTRRRDQTTLWRAAPWRTSRSKSYGKRRTPSVWVWPVEHPWWSATPREEGDQPVTSELR